MAAPTLSESSSLYRKHRPAAFSELVGQAPVVSGLTEAVKSGRVVHAYLFAGPRGTGKTSAARILAKCLNCLTDGPRPDPCGICDACVAITNGTAFDVIEIDAASNRGINEIRELRERVKFAPAQFRTKVYIIDEVHMLTPEAFNALLKTLEEPPEYVVFVLATTELQRVPATILSRCQRYEFRRLAPAVIAEQLKLIAKRESIKVDAAALERMAFLADGAMRDALVVMEQARGFAGAGAIDQAVLDQVFGESHAELFEAIVDALIASDPAKVLAAVATAIERGADPAWMKSELLRWFRFALLAQVAPAVLASEVPADVAARVTGRATRLSRPTVFRALRNLSEIARYSTQPRIDIEMALMRIVRPADELDLAQLSNRLRELEGRLAGSARPTFTVDVERSSLSRPTAPKSTAPKSTTPKSAAASTDLTTTKLRAKWPMVMSEVKSRSMQCFGFLSHASIVDASDDAITLNVEKKFVAESLSDRKCLPILTEVIAELCGGHPRIRIICEARPREALASDFALAESVLGDLM